MYYKKGMNLDHIYNWISFFVLMYKDAKNNKFKIELGDEEINLIDP